MVNDSGADLFLSIRDALNWTPDGVIMATPTHTHFSLAEQVIDAGFDVLIEKPIVNSLKDARVLLKRAKNLKRQVFVVCNMRFHKGVRTLKNNLHKVGKPIFVRSHVGNYLPNMRPNSDYRKLYCASNSRGGGVVLDSIHEMII